jgi:hypothetical protein
MDVNLSEARRFLRLLDRDAMEFTFQTATDAETDKPSPDPQAGHCTRSRARLRPLAERNAERAAVWVMVNEGDGRGRKRENVRRVRAVFADVDGQISLDQLASYDPPPHIIVESSPGHYQAYWLVQGIAVDQFEGIQRAIAQHFGTDPVVDPCRVMRVPGFYHQKDPAHPFQVKIVHTEDLPPYEPKRVLDAFPPIGRARPRLKNGAGEWPELPEPMPQDQVDAIRKVYSDKFDVANYPSASERDMALVGVAYRERAFSTEAAALIRAVRLEEGDPKGKADRGDYIWGVVYKVYGAAFEPDLTILDDQALPAPDLPLPVFGDWWAQWLAAQAEAKGCPVDYVALGLLSTVSALIGAARWGSPWPGWREPAIIWGVAIGNPSSGKSPALETFTDTKGILPEIEIEASQDYPERLAEWKTQVSLAKMRHDLWEKEVKSSLAKHNDTEDDEDTGSKIPEKPADAEPPERPTPPQLVTTDCTIEKLARLVLANPRGLMLFRDELAGWAGNMDRYGGNGGDRAFFVEAYGARRYVVNRMKDEDPIIVPALAVTICGGTTPDKLNSMLLSGEDDGLAARPIYTWPDPIPPKRPTTAPPEGAKQRLARLYQLPIPEQPEPLPMDESAVAALQDYRLHVAREEAEAEGLYKSWLGKLPGRAVRLAVVLQHLYWCSTDSERSPKIITRRAMSAAIVFLKDYATPMAKRCFGSAVLPQADRDARVLAKWLAKQNPLPERVNARDLRRTYVLSAPKAERYDAALAELAEAGWLSSARDKAGPGRKPKDWLVHPQLKEMLRGHK